MLVIVLTSCGTATPRPDPRGDRRVEPGATDHSSMALSSDEAIAAGLRHI